MKSCPACNFSFPDSHHVCDFDGATLVPDPERPPVIKPSPRPSRFQRFLKSRMLLASLAMLVLFLSAVLFGLHNSNGELPPIVKEPPSPSSVSVARAPAQSPAQTSKGFSKRSGVRNLNRLSGSSSASLRREALAQRSVAQQQRTADTKRTQKQEIARRRDGQKSADEKEPKLTAILKTTWNVLKKPFRF